jgi:integrase
MLGTRRGELLALSWNDIDLEAGTVTIRASMSQTKAAVTMKSTKSGKIRVVALSQAARAVFRRQKALQAADKLKKGEHYRNADEAVFTDEIGDRPSPKAGTNAFARIAEKAGVPITSLHGTRHTAATSMISGGVDIRTASAILGHANPSVTLGLYSHVVERHERAAVEVVAERLDRAMRNREVS